MELIEFSSAGQVNKITHYDGDGRIVYDIDLGEIGMVDCSWWDDCPLAGRVDRYKWCTDKCKWYELEIDGELVLRRVCGLARKKLKNLTDSPDTVKMGKNEGENNVQKKTDEEVVF